MTPANPPYLPTEAGAEPLAPAPPRPIARRPAGPPAHDGGGTVEDETHAGSLALLAAWG